MVVHVYPAWQQLFGEGLLTIRQLFLIVSGWKPIILTLWNDSCEDEFLVLGDVISTNPIVAVFCVTGVCYNGVSLSSTAHTCVVINSDLPKTGLLRSFLHALLPKQVVLHRLVSSPIVQCVLDLPHFIEAAFVPASSMGGVKNFSWGDFCDVGSADWAYKEPRLGCKKRKIVSRCLVPVGRNDLPILPRILLSEILIPIVKEVDPFRTICAVGQSSKQLRSLINNDAVASEINLSSAKPSDADSDPYYYLFLERCSEVGNGQAHLLFGVRIWAQSVALRDGYQSCCAICIFNFEDGSC